MAQRMVESATDRIRKYARDLPWEDFLEESLHILTNRIDVSDFFPYLRSKVVIDNADCQDIENKYFNSPNRAMALVDVVKKRGESAFLCFMDVLQYYYPDTFKALTGLTADPPPPEFKKTLRRDPGQERPRQTASQEIMTKMGDIISCMAVDRTAMKDEMNRLMDDMKVEEKRLLSENESLYQKLLDHKHKCDKLEADNKRLLMEKDSQEKEKQEATRQRDDYITRYNEATSVEHREELRTKSLRYTKSTGGNKAMANLNMKEEACNRFLQELEEQRKQLEESDKLHKQQLEELKKERDQVLEKLQNLELQDRERKAENERLRSTNSRLHDRVRSLDEEFVGLKKAKPEVEIDRLKNLVTRLNDQLTKLQPETSVRRTPVSPRQQAPARHGQQHENGVSLLSRMVPTFRQQKVESIPGYSDPGEDDVLSDTVTDACPPLVLSAVHRKPGVRRRRKNPVILLAPEAIRSTLAAALCGSDSFTHCQQTVMDKYEDTWFPKVRDTVFHHERQGDSHIFLERHNLELALRKPSRVLLPVPAEVISTLHAWNIQCTIILVKAVSARDSGKSAEEESLDEINPERKTLLEQVSIPGEDMDKVDVLVKAVLLAMTKLEKRESRTLTDRIP